MLELDEYEMDGIAKLLHIAKRFADRGRLDLLLQASGKDAILSVETYLELEYDLPCLIFEDVTVQRHPEDDWRMFSERTVYIMRDSLLSRFDQLCREYEATRGIMYHYPFSNVDSSGSLCIGANTLPKYKELRKAAGLPALLLSIPNNFDRFDPSDNQLGLDYRDLMQHLKDKEPAYYYTDILIPNGQTLAHFIQHM